MSNDVTLLRVCVSVHTVFSIVNRTGRRVDLSVLELELILSRFTIKRQMTCRRWKPWLPTQVWNILRLPS